jgi:hypothetical protein
VTTSGNPGTPPGWARGGPPGETGHGEIEAIVPSIIMPVAVAVDSMCIVSIVIAVWIISTMVVIYLFK